MRRLKDLGFEGTTLQKGVADMMSFGERTFERGFLQGREITLEKEKVDTAKRMYSKNKYSIEDIAEAINLPVDTTKKILGIGSTYSVNLSIK